MRILFNDTYREVHVKIFNTGKLEIPGIQYDELLTVTIIALLFYVEFFRLKIVQYL